MCGQQVDDDADDDDDDGGKASNISTWNSENILHHQPYPGEKTADILLLLDCFPPEPPGELKLHQSTQSSRNLLVATMPHRSNTVSSFFWVFFYYFFFLSSLCPASRCRSLSDALMLGLLTEHNASNPLLIRLSSSRSPSPLPRSSFLISSLLPLNLLVFSRISPPFHTVTEGWKKNNTSIRKKKFACIFRTFQIHLLLIFFYMPFLNMLFLIIAKQMILQGFSYFPIFFCLEWTKTIKRRPD